MTLEQNSALWGIPLGIRSRHRSYDEKRVRGARARASSMVGFIVIAGQSRPVPVVILAGFVLIFEFVFLFAKSPTIWFFWKVFGDFWALKVLFSKSRQPITLELTMEKIQGKAVR